MLLLDFKKEATKGTHRVSDEVDMKIHTIGVYQIITAKTKASILHPKSKITKYFIKDLEVSKRDFINNIRYL